jgi:hypothetical protein
MAQGHSNKVISQRVGFCAVTAGTLRLRFDQLQLAGISGLPRKIGDQQIEALIA